MPIHDISLEIREEMLSWDDKEELKPQIMEGERSESSGSIKSKICMGSHTGTHVDAPKHFLSDGESVDRVQLHKLIGKCRVLDCTEREQEIKKEDIEDFEEDILVFKTRNSELLSSENFKRDYVYINEEACGKIVDYGYETVGIDYLGIGKYENTRPAHKTLLSKRIIVVEGLDLRNISPGKYEFIGFPLKIRNCDGSPVRAVLKDLS